MFNHTGRNVEVRTCEVPRQISGEALGSNCWLSAERRRVRDRTRVRARTRVRVNGLELGSGFAFRFGLELAGLRFRLELGSAPGFGFRFALELGPAPGSGLKFGLELGSGIEVCFGLSLASSVGIPACGVRPGSLLRLRRHTKWVK